MCTSGTGPYDENVTLDGPYTLESKTGHAADVTIDGQVELDSDNDTVQNLTVTNPDGGFGILINGVNSANVLNNVVSNIGTGSATGNVWAIYYQSHSTGDTSNITIQGNTVSNVGSDSNGTNGGIGIGDTSGAGTINTVSITGNTISGVTAASGKGVYGILVNHGANAGGSVSAPSITNNTVSDLNSGGWATGIGLEGPTPGATVKGNMVSEVSSSVGALTNVGTGLTLQQNGGVATVHINDNSFDYKTMDYLVQNGMPGTTVDATNNYWGTALYSAIAGKMLNANASGLPIFGIVNFEPYYVDSGKTKLSNVMVNDVYVNPGYTDGGTDDNHIFGYDAFSNIQDAVDAPALKDGGTVHVASGTYNTVSVDRPLTLTGVSTAFTLNGDAINIDNSVPQIGTTTLSADNITMNGFWFKGNTTDTLVTVVSSTTLSGDVIKNSLFAAGDTDVSATDAGNLDIENDAFSLPGAGDPQAVSIAGDCSGTTIKNNYFGGPSINNPDIAFSCSSSSNVTVSGNTDDADSRGDTFASLGGIANGLSVTNNTTSGLFKSALIFTGGLTGSATVSGNKLLGTNVGSAIAVKGTNSGTFTLTGNTLTSYADGISIDSGALTGAMNANGNTISGNSTFGIDNSSGITVNAEKNWWGDKTGPYNTPLNPLGTGNAVSANVDFSPFCTDEACDAFGSIDPIASIAVVANPTTLDTGNYSTVTVTGKDASGYPVVNDTSTQIHFSADHGASLGALYVPFGMDGTATTTVTNSVAGVVNVGAEVVSASPAVTGSTQVTFNQGPIVDTTPPTISNIQAVSIGPSTATITWTTDEPATSQVEYGLTSGYGTLSSLDSTLATTHSVTLSGLASSTEYHFRVASADATGNLASSTDNTFMTAVDNTSAGLAVTGIDATKTFATPDGSFDDGWQWVFHVTVPENETNLQMKFDDFTGLSTTTIPAANDIRFYSAQSTNATASTSAIVIAGANAYSSTMTLNPSADLSASAAGRQINITVDVAVPAGTSGGAYSTSYGINTF
ncbi:MAG: beta strand repeat-containing protein [Minisyncoccia bacterium]